MDADNKASHPWTELAEARALIADLKNALARERGGGSPLDRMSYILLNEMAGDFLARPLHRDILDFDEQEDDEFYADVTRAEGEA